MTGLDPVIFSAEEDGRVEHGHDVVLNMFHHEALAARAKSLALIFWLSLFNCPQAAMISRPRGVRTGEA